MTSEIENLSLISANSKIDPTGFDITISSLLIGVGAERYINIFRKQNIGQCTLSELTDEDLIKLGVDDSTIRQKLLEEVKNLPLYEESSIAESKISANLGLIEIVDVLEESGQHLYRMYLSMLANTLALKKNKKTPDCLLHKDKYASDIALSTLNEMSTILNNMEISLHTQLKAYTRESKSKTNKKLLVGSLGSAAIVVLAVLFVRSLKQLH